MKNQPRMLQRTYRVTVAQDKKVKAVAKKRKVGEAVIIRELIEKMK